MRVVAGSVKGHHLRMPRGRQTRPTSDKVREAIFSILGGTLEAGAALDLFAGTGAMGIEALSRGATSATFIERWRPACQCIAANLEHTHLESSSSVICRSVEAALPTLTESFELIMLDPPYAYPNLHGIMAMIGGARVVGSETRVVFEHSPRFSVEERYGPLALQRQKVYGDTAVSMFAAQEEQNE